MTKEETHKKKVAAHNDKVRDKIEDKKKEEAKAAATNATKAAAAGKDAAAAGKAAAAPAKAAAAKTTTGRSSGINFNGIPSLKAKPTTTTARTPTNPKRVVNNNNKLPAGLLTISLLYSKAGTNNKTQ